MSGLEAIGALRATGLEAGPIIGAASPPPAATISAGPVSFADLLTTGLEQVDRRVASANDMVRRFALDDSVPLHQVTYALEEARLTVELAMQVQTRVTEAYRQLMNMQL